MRKHEGKPDTLSASGYWTNSWKRNLNIQMGFAVKQNKSFTRETSELVRFVMPSIAGDTDNVGPHVISRPEATLDSFKYLSKMKPGDRVTNIATGQVGVIEL